MLAADGFKMQTPLSKSAVQDTRNLLQWFPLPSNEVFYECAEKLVSDVDRCFDPSKKERKCCKEGAKLCGAHITN